MADITVRSSGDVDQPVASTDVTREMIFETDDTLMVRSQVGGGVTTGWHHNGDRDVFGYVVRGTATLEYGPGGQESVELAEGAFVHVPPRTIRRVVNEAEEDWIIVICFVGAGPPAVAVDGPERAGE